MRPYTLKKQKVDSYLVRVANSCVWGEAFLRGGKGTCVLAIQSDYGSYSYSWGYTGCDDPREFLLRLDKQYLMKKIGVGMDKIYRFNPDDTIKAMRKEILIMRLETAIDKETARAAWLELDEMEISYIDNRALFYNHLHTNCVTLYGTIYEDLGDVPERSEYCPQVEGFWEEIWPLFCDTWKKELGDSNDSMQTKGSGPPSD